VPDRAPAWGRKPAAALAVLFRFKELLGEQRALLARTLSEERKTMRTRTGDHARHGGGRIRLRRAAAAQGMNSAKGWAPAVDTYGVAPAAGRCRRHHAFNFPGDVPMWMFPLASPAQCFILKPSERDPSASLLGAAAEGAGLAMDCSMSCRRQGGAVDAILQHAGMPRIELRRSTRCTVIQSQASVGNACGVGGAKIMPWSCPMRT